MPSYYESDDLAKFRHLAEHAPALGKKFFDWYGAAIKGGAALVHGVQMKNVIEELGM